MVQLKVHDGHLTSQVANKCLNIHEGVEVADWKKKDGHLLPLLSYESPVSVKEDPDGKKHFILYIL